MAPPNHCHALIRFFPALTACLLLEACASSPNTAGRPGAAVNQAAPVGNLEQETLAPPLCVSKLDQQIASEIKKLGDSQSERSGSYYLLLPASAEHYRKLNKIAILGVSLFSRNPDDLPAARINVVHQSAAEKKPRLAALPLIFRFAPVEDLEESSPLSQKLGRYRQDLYLFIPIRFLSRPGQLVARLKNKVSTLPLGRFPIPVKENFIRKDERPHEDPGKLPDPAVVTALVRKNFCFGIPKKDLFPPE